MSNDQAAARSEAQAEPAPGQASAQEPADPAEAGPPAAEAATGHEVAEEEVTQEQQALLQNTAWPRGVASGIEGKLYLIKKLNRDEESDDAAAQ